MTLGRVTLAPRVPAVGALGNISGSRQKPPKHAPTDAGSIPLNTPISKGEQSGGEARSGAAGPRDASADA